MSFLFITFSAFLVFVIFSDDEFFKNLYQLINFRDNFFQTFSKQFFFGAKTKLGHFKNSHSKPNKSTKIKILIKKKYKNPDKLIGGSMFDCNR